MQITLPKNSQHAQVSERTRSAQINMRLIWILLFLASVIWALTFSDILGRDILNTGGWSVMAEFFRAMIHPDFSPDFLRLTFEATLTTMAYAIAGLALSVVFGFFGGIMGSEIWWQSLPGAKTNVLFRFTRWVIRIIFAVARAIHEVVWGLFFLNIIGLDPLSAILAIAIPYSAIIAKIYSEILDETPHQALEALKNSGVSTPKAVLYGLLPQAFPDMLAYSFYRFECAIRSSAVLGIIGAGGLGYQIFLSLQTLKYEQIWTLLLALFLINGLAGYWSSSVRRRIGTTKACDSDCSELEIHKSSATGTHYSLLADRLLRVSVIMAAVLVPLAFFFVRPDFMRLVRPQTAEQFGMIARSAWPPDFSNLSWNGWLNQISITLAMSILAIASAGALAYLFAFPAANKAFFQREYGSTLERWTHSGMSLITRVVLLVTRSIPAPIWALLLLFVLFPGIIPGAAALGIFTLGVFGRLMAESIENTDTRPMRSLQSLGASPALVFAYATLPLTFPKFIIYLFTRWEEVVRSTVVIGLVGAGGLGRLLVEQISSFDYRSLSATLIVFIAIILLVDSISNSVRKNFR
jgi:phosphonate transport system permease protein